MQQYYIPSARELSRLVGVCKAPVIQHFAETISGSTTIRSFDQEARFQDTNMKLMDGYSRPKLFLWELSIQVSDSRIIDYPSCYRQSLVKNFVTNLLSFPF